MTSTPFGPVDPDWDWLPSPDEVEMGVGSVEGFVDDLAPIGEGMLVAAESSAGAATATATAADVGDAVARTDSWQSGGRVRLPVSALTDAGPQARDSLRPLTAGQFRLVERLAWFGPVSDALLAALNGACGDGAASAVSIRRNVSDQRPWGYVGARDALHGGSKARFATASGRALVGAGEPVESWSDLEVSEHLLRLDAAVQVLGRCRQVISRRQIMASATFEVVVDGEPVVLGQPGWVPVVWAQDLGSRQGTAVFVLDQVESSTIVLRPDLPAVYANLSYSRVILVVPDAVRRERVAELIDELGFGAVCRVAVVNGPRWLRLRA